MEYEEPILINWLSSYNIREKLAELNVNGAETDMHFLCSANLFAFMATNSHVTDKQSAASSKCSISIVLPMSDIADFNLVKKYCRATSIP